MNGRPDGSKGLPEGPPVLPREPVQRWRLVLARSALAPDGVQRQQLGAWEAALVASGLPVAGLDAERPRARFAPGAPLGASIPGEAELLDVWLVERLPVWRVREALEQVVPPGWRLVGLHDVWLGEAALPGRVTGSVYRATLDASLPVDHVRRAAAALLAAETLPRERRKGEGLVAYDLRPFIEELSVAGDAAATGPVLHMTLRHDPEKGVGRPEEVLAALGEAAGTALTPTSLVRERLVLGEPPAPPPAAPRRRPAPAAARDRPDRRPGPR